eukprot:scaffold265996_cov31-Tisochrysis_lutea.AAC.1
MWEAGSRCRMRNTWRSGAEAHAGLEWGKDLLWVLPPRHTSHSPWVMYKTRAAKMKVQTMM